MTTSMWNLIKGFPPAIGTYSYDSVFYLQATLNQ